VKSATLRYGDAAQVGAVVFVREAAACSVLTAASSASTGSVSVGTARASAVWDKIVASDVRHVMGSIDTGSPVSWPYMTTVAATSVWPRKRSRIACPNVAGSAERGDSLRASCCVRVDG
jgi:hypothetical protein